MDDKPHMTRRQILVQGGGAVLFTTLFAGERPARAAAPDVTTSWVGNTFSGATEWVQDFVFNMAVTPDGTIYTVSFWDEAGNYAGVYKDAHMTGNCPRANGDAVAVNSTNAYLSIGTGLTAFTLAGAATSLTFDVGSPPAAAAAGDTQVIATDRARNRVMVFDAKTGALTRTWSVNRPGAVAVDRTSGEIWVVANVTRDTNDGHFWHVDRAEPARILHFSNTGAVLPGTIAGPSPDWIPTSLAIDRDRNLLVGDNGPLRQVHTYTDLSAATPVKARSLGQAGGIGAGNPGLVRPDKLFGITGVGGDSAGNVYVAMCEFGTWLRKYGPAGNLVWQLMGAEFVTTADFDPGTDGQDVYSQQNHYRMDYTKPPGGNATWVGYSLDSVKYPQDPRLFLTGHQHHVSSPSLRRLNNNRLYMYATGMYCSHLLIYRYEGEIAKPSGAIFKAHWTGDDPTWPPYQPASGEWIWRDKNGDGKFTADEYITTGTGANSPGNCWVWFVDDRGDIWEGGDRNLRRYPLQGFDGQLNPMYDYTSRVTLPLPQPFTNVRRLHYEVATDVMYMSGYTAAQPFENAYWKECGKVLARYDRWSTGNTTPTWTILLPWNVSATPPVTTVSWAPAGDYLFSCGVTTRGQVWAWRAADGSAAGNWLPGANVGGVSRTGWVDIPYGLNAMKRSDGSYQITVEDDLFNKVLLYSWLPG
ncbi:hypothetical protein ACFPOI_33280 [Nonomuraea angiospora]|uniref:Tat pathway signal sequence domain protein n=1 Tax=Nonomuraea angiospora TaxID=46172 RepID=A0ABR9LSS6_9ACTN|nr:hypothetical protein [Nonomuraea angiospora]MBE1583709.1 hypothetical protein [Nonomuraea angiospora]